jgi:hypothetical protein
MHGEPVGPDALAVDGDRLPLGQRRPRLRRELLVVVASVLQRDSELPLWYFCQSQAISIKTRRPQLLPALEMPWQRLVEPLS